MEKGKTYVSRLFVTEECTASVIGSGELPVLATPVLVALMEKAAMLAVADELSDGSTTVGGSIDIKHLKPSAVGAEVVATATLTEVDGRRLGFHVVAREGDAVVGEAEHQRFVVDKDRFMSKLSQKEK